MVIVLNIILACCMLTYKKVHYYVGLNTFKTQYITLYALYMNCIKCYVCLCLAINYSISYINCNYDCIMNVIGVTD